MYLAKENLSEALTNLEKAEALGGSNSDILTNKGRAVVSRKENNYGRNSLTTILLIYEFSIKIGYLTNRE